MPESSPKNKSIPDTSEAHRLRLRIRRQFMTGIRRFSLTADGDHVLVGLSGGKDSLTLMEFLGEAAQRSGGRFRVSALHVRMDNVDYRSDCTYLHTMTRQAGVGLIVKTGHFEPDRNARRTPCFLCSWHRRKLLFATAQEMGCNKIALGHHQDDILKTAMMNLIYTGSFATMPARLAMRKFPVTIIRPLCMVAERDLTAWAALRGFHPVEKVCPYDKTTSRTAVSRVLQEMESLNPEFRYSLWHALEKEGKLAEDTGVAE